MKTTENKNLKKEKERKMIVKIFNKKLEIFHVLLGILAIFISYLEYYYIFSNENFSSAILNRISPDYYYLPLSNIFSQDSSISTLIAVLLFIPTIIINIVLFFFWILLSAFCVILFYSFLFLHFVVGSLLGILSIYWVILSFFGNNKAVIAINKLSPFYRILFPFGTLFANWYSKQKLKNEIKDESIN